MSWTDQEKYKAWREANAEKRREYDRRYRLKHHEQVLERERRYREAHREQINARRRKTKENIPAGDGTITVDLDRRDSWNQKARSTEDVLFHAEFGMGYDEMEKYRRIKEYE